MNFDDLNEQHNAENESQMLSSIWIISMADLFSLILTFFIMLYSMKDTAEPKLTEIKDSFIEYTRGITKEKQYNFIYKKNYDVKYIKKSGNLSYIETVFRNSIADRNDIIVYQGNNQLILEFLTSYNSLVNSEDDFRDKISLLSKTINSLSNQLEVKVSGLEPSRSLQVAKLVSDEINQAGYDYEILKTVNNDVTESLEKNENNLKIQILVKGYEFAF